MSTTRSPLEHDELVSRISRDLADGYDEELEMEIEDRHPLPGAQSAVLAGYQLRGAAAAFTALLAELDCHSADPPATLRPVLSVTAHRRLRRAASQGSYRRHRSTAPVGIGCRGCHLLAVSTAHRLHCGARQASSHSNPQKSIRRRVVSSRLPTRSS